MTTSDTSAIDHHTLEDQRRRRAATPGRRFLRRFMRHRLAVASAILLIVLIITAIAAPIVAPHDPLAIDARALRKPPTPAHLLGTDDAGRDMLSRLIWGAQISLAVGLVAASISVTIGTLIGLASGFLGGKVDFWLMRLTDVVMTIPTLIIIISLVAVLGPSIYNVMLVIGIFGWAGIRAPGASGNTEPA